MWGWQPHLLEPSGPHQACYGTPFPPFVYQFRTHSVKMIIFIINAFLIFHSTMHYYAYNFDCYHRSTENRHFADFFHGLKMLFSSNRSHCRWNMLIPQCKWLEHSILPVFKESKLLRCLLTAVKFIKIFTIS